MNAEPHTHNTPVKLKRFGQHFLHNPHTLQRIIDEIAPQPGESFIEIGPGGGVLTLPLAESGAQVLALEVDPRLVAELQRHQLPNLCILHADALQDDIFSLMDKHQLTPPSRLVGNLPYNISVPLLEKFLRLAVFGVPLTGDPTESSTTSQPPHRKLKLTDMHFMVQQEIAQRMFATQDDKQYGRLSLLIQCLAEGEKLFNVARGDFDPPPKVTSSFCRLQPKLHPYFEQFEPAAAQKFSELNNLIQQAFGRPNRKLRNTLAAFMEHTKLNQSPHATKRARAMSLANFIELLDSRHT